MLKSKLCEKNELAKIRINVLLNFATAPCCFLLFTSELEYLKLLFDLHVTGNIQVERNQGVGVKHERCTVTYLVTDSLGCPWWIISLKKSKKIMPQKDWKWKEMMTECHAWLLKILSCALLLQDQCWQCRNSVRHPWMRLKWAKAASPWVCDPVLHHIFVNCHLYKMWQILIMMRLVLCTYCSNVKTWKCFCF